MENKSLFLRTYANLPQASRDEIIAVIAGEPYTWKSARIEIENTTAIGQKILELLIGLGILKHNG